MLCPAIRSRLAARLPTHRSLHFEAELLPLLGVRRSQARQHLRLLRFAGERSIGPPSKITATPSASPNRPESEKADSIVGDESIQSESIDSKQQHPKPVVQLSAAGDEVYRRALGYLSRAGVWPDVAQRLAEQSASIQRSGEEDEKPVLSPKSGDVLAPGMVVTVEPGFYVEEYGGVRIEDMLLVTQDGAEVMSRAVPKLLDH